MRRVVVHIENLVLRGFQHADQRALAQGLQEQLFRLLSQPAAIEQLSQLGSIPDVHAGSFVVDPGSRLARVGSDAATQICTGLSL